jgi:hypothetical protein
VCEGKCIPPGGCCGSCPGNRVCNAQNMCVCPAGECGNLCCPAGQTCIPSGRGGPRCGIPPLPDPTIPPGGQPP